MSLYEKIEQVGASVFGAFILSVGGGIMWVIRRILTYEKMLAMMSAEINRRDEWFRGDIARRDKQRDEDREAVREVRDDVKAIRTEIRDVFRRLE